VLACHYSQCYSVVQPKSQSAIAHQDTCTCNIFAARVLLPSRKACLSLLFNVTAQGNGVLRVLFDDLLHKRYAQRCCIALLPGAAHASLT